MSESIERNLKSSCNFVIQLINRRCDNLKLPDFELGVVDFLMAVRDSDILINELENEDKTWEFANPKGNEAYYSGYLEAVEKVKEFYDILIRDYDNKDDLLRDLK